MKNQKTLPKDVTTLWPQKTDALEEIAQEREYLRSLNLTEEDIEGYIAFYIENWFPVPIVKGRPS
jgi:hypothetical protein